MKVRQYAPSDYETLKSWWDKREWVHTPEWAMPTVGGFVTETEDGEPISAVFTYISANARIAMVTNPIANPEFDGLTIKKSLMLGLERAKEFAKVNNCVSMFTTTVRRSLVRLYKQVGFMEADAHVTELICNLGE